MPVMAAGLDGARARFSAALIEDRVDGVGAVLSTCKAAAEYAKPAVGPRSPRQLPGHRDCAV